MALSRDARGSCAQASYQGICQHGRTGETGSQGIKDRSATLDQHTDPDNCEPADTIPGAPAHRKPDAHRTAATADVSRAGVLKPGLPTPPTWSAGVGTSVPAGSIRRSSGSAYDCELSVMFAVVGRRWLPCGSPQGARDVVLP